ncbi:MULTISPECIES: carbohydrate kinase family protein [Bacteria]|mgnify:FL=1
MSEEVLVVGESLIDIVRTVGEPGVEVVGGSPANVALGMGRLGTTPRLLTALGNDARGHRIAELLERSGVKIDPASWSLQHTATAAALIDARGVAQYEFDIEWNVPAPIQLAAAQVVHLGSIAAFLPPGADTLTAFIDELQGQAMVTFDPNIRPALVGSHASAVARVEHLASRSNVVKLSDEDASWLWPAASSDEVLDHLLECGATLVALTLGGAGAAAATRDHRVQIAAPTVPVVDTVGAGDTFMAALIHRLVTQPDLLHSTSESELIRAVHFAVIAASITVQRAGADLPTTKDVHAALQSQSGVAAKETLR